MTKEHTKRWPDGLSMVDRYAHIVAGPAAGLCPDQSLNLSCSDLHEDLAYRIGEAGYVLGAREVYYRIPDPAQLEQLIRCGTPEQIERHHQEDRAFYARVWRDQGVLISLVDNLEPPEWSTRLSRTHPENYETFMKGKIATKIQLFRDIDRLEVQYVIAPGATSRWALRVFPELGERRALQCLWDWIFRLTYADREDAARRIAAQEARRQARIRKLNELKIREILARGGETNLRVRLSPRARWMGSALRTKAGRVFHANFPSWEIYTTPERHGVSGRLAASLPFRVFGGVEVHDLVMDFEDGRLVSFDASTGRDELSRWLETDDGARYLGEFALVGEESAVRRSGICFGQFYLDENAASHVALGQGLPICFEGGEDLSPAQLEELGCNDSKTHQDIIFGSPDVSIVATRSREGEVVLMEGGRWADRFGPEEPG